MRWTGFLGLAVATVVVAGCTAAPARPAPAAGVALPPCTSAVAAAPALTVGTSMLRSGGEPWGLATTPDGRYAFAAVDNPFSLLVLSTVAAEPRLVRTIDVGGAPEGAALSPDGRYLLVASSAGTIVISVARAETGAGDPVLGTLPAPDSSANEVAFSADSAFAFVTIEGQDEAAVYNLSQALASGFTKSGLVGYIPLGVSPAGLALSPDGQDLYITSQGKTQNTLEGTLSVVRVATAETDPAKSVVNIVAAGCNPVRVIVSADGKDVWVSARASDAVLAFSAAALQGGTAATALLGWTRVGEAPVGLALVKRGTLVVVADSDRFGGRGQLADLGVVNVADVLARRPGLVATIASGQFPREVAVAAAGKTLLASNYDSGQIEAVPVAGLP
jgi:DNA-binding beta-propeller fold protein YncE